MLNGAPNWKLGILGVIIGSPPALLESIGLAPPPDTPPPNPAYAGGSEIGPGWGC